MKQLVYQVCCTRYHVSFCLWLIRSVLKHYKVPKYYDQDCLKIFFSPSTLPMMIQISTKKMLIWFKKVSFIRKLPISNGESFLESIFQNTAYTKPLNLEF